jgi:energy-coupling factor transporter ATP-binding protein EcfA2
MKRRGAARRAAPRPAFASVNPAFLVESLSYAYPADEPAFVLSGASFSIAPGELVGLLGRVGAGKSTLCLALNGLAPRATGGVFRGQVRVFGRDTRETPVEALATVAGSVFQDVESQLTQMRVEDEVAFGPENLGLARDEIDRRITWALEVTGLAGFRDRSPLRLSGGEKQRLAIASVLAMRPMGLVLDEPTASIDPGGKAAFFGLLERLARDECMAILVATQELEWVGRYAHRLLVLNDGRIALDGPREKVFAHQDRLEEWGIGAPVLSGLSRALHRRTGRVFHFADLPDALEQLGARPVNGPPAAPGGQAAAPTLVAIRDLSYSYPDGTGALSDVSLTIASGEFVAIVGPNGSGKTTLGKHLNGLLKPSAGSVEVAGNDTRATPTPMLARVVGYLFQDPDHQIFAPTVREEVAFGPHVLGMSTEETAARAESALAAFGLLPLVDRPPATLGRGERRQVALAAVLASGPQLLVLDEPAGDLDAAGRRELMAVAHDFNAAGGAVILITHDLSLVCGHAPRSVVLTAGRLVYDGPTAELFRHDAPAAAALEQAGLIAPPLAWLAARLMPGVPLNDVSDPEGFARSWAATQETPGIGEAQGEAHHGL